MNTRALSGSIIVGILLALTVSGCQGTASERRQAVLSGTQGDRVSSVCFVRDIRNWYAFDDRSLIIQRGRDNYYRLELIGACDTSQAFMTLRTQSRSGICLSPGDRISFPHDRGMSCSVTRIYEWFPADPETDAEMIPEEATEQ